MPHHVTQRGNRRQQTFFNEGDYPAYPLGNVSFVERLERMVGRILAPRQGGRPPKLRRLP